MSPHVIPKSDQLNADDLLSGPRTIKITKVSGTGAADQPVAVYFEGDDGKPYKPCKSMRRVMIAGWGVDAAQYVGRSMTIYCDPKVVFGGMAVGGVRISHMSDIAQPLNLALTVTKAKRAQYRVTPIVAKAPAPEATDPFGLPPLPDAEPAPDTAALWKTYTTMKKDGVDPEPWAASLRPRAQKYVRKLIATDAAAVAQSEAQT